MNTYHSNNTTNVNHTIHTPPHGTRTEDPMSPSHIVPSLPHNQYNHHSTDMRQGQIGHLNTPMELSSRTVVGHENRNNGGLWGDK